MERWDTDYLRSREDAERNAAGKTSNDAARDAHLALAERYHEMAGALDQPQLVERVTTSVPVGAGMAEDRSKAAMPGMLPWLPDSGRPKGSVRRI